MENTSHYENLFIFNRELTFETTNAKLLINAINNLIDIGNMNASQSTQELKDNAENIIKDNDKQIKINLEKLTQYEDSI
tara:strand:+ start:592 stop:828 length:237 start_codon:yes stop_codon:yes gene_type:complete